MAKNDSIIDILLAGAGVVIGAVALSFFMTYRGYKNIRRMDGEYKINDDVRQAREELRELVEDVMPLSLLDKGHNPTFKKSHEIDRYKTALNNAVAFYEARREVHCANEFIRELNFLAK